MRMSKVIGNLIEVWMKMSHVLKKEGIIQLIKKVNKKFVKEVFGKSSFPEVLDISYSRLWTKVWESFGTKNPLVFFARFVVVLLFGWVTLLFPSKNSFEAAPQEIKQWFSKNHKKTTVVIPTYNDYKLVRNCVDSIRELTSGKYLDIVVVDDGSSTEVQRKLKELNLEVKLILKKDNEGFARTCNAGIEAVKTGNIVLLNNDTIVHDGWIESLQYFADLEKNIGIVGPKLLYPDGTIQWAGTHRNPEQRKWFDHTFRFKQSNYGPANVHTEVLAITGACMYIKRSVINKIGSLDPKFKMAFEDVDYSLRAWESGFKLFYVPTARVTHFESKTRGKVQGDREISSLNYFWKKWGNWFDNRIVTNKEGKLKIIYVMQDTGVAGGHRDIFEHLNGLAAAGHEVSLYSLAKTPTWFDLKVPVKTFRSYEALEKDLATQECVKVATWWETSPVVWRSSVVKGIPVFFVQDIETSYYEENNPIRNHVLAWYKKEFRYLTISGWDKEQLAQLGLESVIVAPGLDTSVFKVKKLERENNTLLAVGRSHHLKNLDFTVRAWRKMVKKPKLALFGIEPSLGPKLGAKYSFNPDDDGVADLYNKATIFVQTSRHEGFSLPILEAMACGTPVVCTDADGNMDFCVDGRNCLMVEQDNVEQLKEALERMFSDENLRQRLAKEGLVTASKYGWDVKKKELERFYKKIATPKAI